MQLTKCYSIFFFVSMAQTATCFEREIDIDKLQYLCGNDLPAMMSRYCHTYYSKQAKREITRACCDGLGCSIRYLMFNYCKVVKSEYAHLFLKARGDSSDSAESQKFLTNKPSNVKPEQSPDSHSKTIINAIRKSFVESSQAAGINHMDRDRESITTRPRNSQVRTCKSRKLVSHSRSRSQNQNSKQPMQKSFKRSFRHDHKLGRQCECQCVRRNRPGKGPSPSRSFVGFDYVPAGNPVHPKANFAL